MPVTHNGIGIVVMHDMHMHVEAGNNCTYFESMLPQAEIIFL